MKFKTLDLGMNLQIDVAWNEHPDGCSSTVWKGCIQACPQEQAFLTSFYKSWTFLQGGDTHLVTAQDPIVSLFHSGEHS